MQSLSLKLGMAAAPLVITDAVDATVEDARARGMPIQKTKGHVLVVRANCIFYGIMFGQPVNFVCTEGHCHLWPCLDRN